MKHFGYGWAIGPAILAISMAGCSAAKMDKGGSSGQTSSGGGAGSGAANSGKTDGSGGSASGGGSMDQAGGGAAGSKSGGGAAGKKGSGASGMSGSMAGNGASGSDAMMNAQAMLDPDVDWTALTLVFAKMYSAYDGEHTFSIPAHVDMTAVDLADWQSIPADAVTFDPDPDVDGGVMITIVKGVEDVTIAARANKLGGTAELHVTLATPDDWHTGEMRYNNGVDYTLPELNFADLIDPNWMPPPTPKNLACNNCHSTGAKYFEIQHTPTQIGNLSDDDLITIFTTGMKPPGVPYHVLPEEFQHLYPEFHTWDASPEEEKGLIVYLRSLTPTGQGMVSVPDGGIM